MGKKLTIHHGLELGLARRAIGKGMAAYSERFADYDPMFAWDDETRGHLSFAAKGLKVTGRIEINGPDVTLELEVPFLLRIFSGKALEVIDREVRVWIEKAKNGEID